MTALTSQPPSAGTTPPPAPSRSSTGELIGQLSDQVSRLVRDEVRLAQAEVTQKAGLQADVATVKQAVSR
jgi:hypothetical protein